MIIETGALVLVVAGIVEAFKRASGLPSRYVPILAILVGVGITCLQHLDIALGIMIGLTSCGLYDFGKKTLLGK